MLIYLAYLMYKCATGQTSWAEIKAKVKAGKANAKAGKAADLQVTPPQGKS